MVLNGTLSLLKQLNLTIVYFIVFHSLLKISMSTSRQTRHRGWLGLVTLAASRPCTFVQKEQLHVVHFIQKHSRLSLSADCHLLRI